MTARTVAARAANTGVQLLTPDQAAGRLGCSRDTVERLIAAGQLRWVDIRSPQATRPRVRVRESDLAAFIDARTRVA